MPRVSALSTMTTMRRMTTMRHLGVIVIVGWRGSDVIVVGHRSVGRVVIVVLIVIPLVGGG